MTWLACNPRDFDQEYKRKTTVEEGENDRIARSEVTEVELPAYGATLTVETEHALVDGRLVTAGSTAVIQVPIPWSSDQREGVALRMELDGELSHDGVLERLRDILGHGCDLEAFVQEGAGGDQDVIRTAAVMNEMDSSTTQDARFLLADNPDLARHDPQWIRDMAAMDRIERDMVAERLTAAPEMTPTAAIEETTKARLREAVEVAKRIRLELLKEQAARGITNEELRPFEGFTGEGLSARESSLRYEYDAYLADLDRLQTKVAEARSREQAPTYDPDVKPPVRAADAPDPEPERPEDAVTNMRRSNLVERRLGADRAENAVVAEHTVRGVPMAEELEAVEAELAIRKVEPATTRVERHRRALASLRVGVNPARTLDLTEVEIVALGQYAEHMREWEAHRLSNGLAPDNGKQAAREQAMDERLERYEYGAGVADAPARDRRMGMRMGC